MCKNLVEVTVEITQYCPYECKYCSSNASPKGKHLKKGRILLFLKDLKNVTRINISGGEPLSHPDFYEILEKCYEITPKVWVYSNVIKNLIFNSDIIEEVNVEANTVVVPGETIYIPKKVDKVHLLKLVHQGRAKNLPKTEVKVSSNFKDCTRSCNECSHLLLQADGQIVQAPCTKKYRSEKELKQKYL